MGLFDIITGRLDRAGVGGRPLTFIRNNLGKFFGGYILAYHTITTERFIEQIESLLPDRPIPLSELLERHKNQYSTKGLFAITFDDGYRDTVLDIFRLAIDHDLPVTFYLPTDYLNGKPMPALILKNLSAKIPDIVMTLSGIEYDLTHPEAKERFFRTLTKRMNHEKESIFYPLIEEIIEFNLRHEFLREKDIFDIPQPISWEHVLAYSKYEQISFESHGISHQAVGSLSERELEYELSQSKEQISKFSKKDVNHFCYPYGGNDSIGILAPEVVSRYFKSAVTMNRGRLDKCNQHLLPRIPLYQKDSKILTNIKLFTI
jgi:peptidoglycan/xylan/chitin deacetylase (PgdA/CDA1 family)